METREPPIPFEDFGKNALWRTTYLSELPWAETPRIMRGLPWGPENQGPMFFKHDFWHNWHNGVAKTYVSSCCVVLNQAELLPGRSVDARFDALSEDYQSWCKRVHISPYVKELSRDTFGMDSSLSFPTGCWNKALVSTQLMLYLEDFCDRFIDPAETEDRLLLTIEICLQLVLSFTFGCYS